MATIKRRGKQTPENPGGEAEEIIVPDPPRENAGTFNIEMEESVQLWVHPSNFFVVKGKVLAKKVAIEFFERMPGSKAPDTDKKVSKRPPHQELLNAFKRLTIHACIAGDFIKATEIENIKRVPAKLIEKFKCTGFTIIGGEEMTGVILSAYKILPGNQIIPFPTPIIRNSPPPEEVEEGAEAKKEDKNNAYVFVDDLFTVIRRCQSELILYKNGKQAPDPQGDLFAQESK